MNHLIEVNDFACKLFASGKSCALLENVRSPALLNTN